MVGIGSSGHNEPSQYRGLLIRISPNTEKKIFVACGADDGRANAVRAAVVEGTFPSHIHTPLAPEYEQGFDVAVVLLRQLRCGCVGKPAEFAMLHRQQYAPARIHSLTNHLDATLAACKELLELKGTAAAPDRLLLLELTVIAHVLQARHDMNEVGFEDDTLTGQMALFLAVTDCLEDASSSSAGKTEADANHLIGGRIPIATIMALAAAMRDVLGVCYALYDGDREVEFLQPQSPIPEALVWATGPDGA